MVRIVFGLQSLLILLIRLYQWCVRPAMKPCCRFFPSCSDYAIEALRYYGVCKGGFLAARRLLRCHPWAKGGYDPLLAENIPPFTNEKFE